MNQKEIIMNTVTMATRSDLLGLTPVKDSIFQTIMLQIKMAEREKRIFIK